MVRLVVEFAQLAGELAVQDNIHRLFRSALLSIDGTPGQAIAALLLAGGHATDRDRFVRPWCRTSAEASQVQSEGLDQNGRPPVY